MTRKFQSPWPESAIQPAATTRNKSSQIKRHPNVSVCSPKYIAFGCITNPGLMGLRIT
jgi:hypothetical protein